MKSKTVFTLAIVAMTLSLAMVAEARPGRGRGKGPGGGIEMMLRNVELTDGQRTQLMALRDEHQAEMKPLHQEMKAKRQQMRQLWTAEVIDEEAIWALDADMAPLREQLRRERVEQRLQAMNVLTPEQRAQLADAMERKFERRKSGKR